MNYKIISFDLDGTILDQHKNISNELCSWVKNFQQQGGRIVLSSGRKFSEIKSYVNLLELPIYNGFVISSSGLYLHDLRTNITKTFNTIDITRLNEIIRMLVSNKTAHSYIVVCDNKDYILKNISFAERLLRNIYLKILGAKQCFVSVESKLKIKGRIEKVICSTTDIDLVRESIAAANDVHAKVIDGNRVEIYYKTVDKYYALQHLLNKLHLSEQELLLFGDDENDLMCFEHFSNTIAMMNAVPVLKQYSQSIAPSNKENGVYKFLNNLNLIK